MGNVPDGLFVGVARHFTTFRTVNPRIEGISEIADHFVAKQKQAKRKFLQWTIILRHEAPLNNSGLELS
jgi:hypothetical protein